MMMRRWSGIGVILIGCALAGACVSTGYHETVSMGTIAPVARPGGWDQPFYSDLAPHGRWVFVSGPGWVWSPDNVQVGWRPYQLGHWVYTDHGWTWASDEEWGWAVYHYGRWHLDASFGWVWVPGTEWGPAWVAWHEGGGYVGWAPLPWQVTFRAGVGLDWGGVSVTIAPSWWSFASARHLVDPGLRTRIVPVERNTTLIRVTQNVTNYTYIDNRVVNQGVRVEKIGRAVGHTIPRYRVSQDDAPDVSRGGKVRGQDFVVYRADPVRGRNSHGRDSDSRGGRGRVTGDRDPRHQDHRDRPRGDRPGRPEPDADPPAHQPEDAQEPPDSTPPVTNRGQERLEKQPPARAPQRTAPDDHSSGTRPGDSGADSRQNATAPPGKPDHGKGQPARESLRDKAKPGKDAASRGRKPKQETPKPDEPDDDEPKENKHDSGS